MKVAVVGSGVSGLATTWLLNEYSDHEVHLFEANDYVGGHTHTVEYTRDGKTVNVDTGFIVCNRVTYPNLLRFFEIKSVPLVDSDMSFAVSRDRGAYEWSGKGIGSVFAQTINIFNPAQWRLVWDVLRFNTFSLDILKDTADKYKTMSIGEYIEQNGYSDSFRDNYLLPMTAAVWSTPPDKCALDFPAITLIRFMHNHHLLQVADRPIWLTVKDGSRTYVDSILAELPPERLHVSTPVESVSSISGAGEGSASAVKLKVVTGEEFQFDHVLLACHGDQALEILEKGRGGATPDEKDILSKFKTSTNTAVLHSDNDLMPLRRATWSAWNYLTSSEGAKANVNQVSLTYSMNILQSIAVEEFGPVLVTLNPPFPPHKSKTAGSWTYEHPLYTEESVAAQSRLPQIQGKRGITFAGAWTKYGFHEDGFTSGMRVAATYLGVEPPFEILPAERSLQTTAVEDVGRVTLDLLEKIRRLAEPAFGWLLALASILLLLLQYTFSSVERLISAFVTDPSRTPARKTVLHLYRSVQKAGLQVRRVRSMWLARDVPVEAARKIE